MKLIQFLPVVLFSVAVIGCDNSSKEDKTSSEKVTAPVPAPSTTSISTPSTNTVEPIKTEVTPQTATTIKPTPGATVVQPIAAPVKSAAGLNPAHGQPGHRCDISVGAPLDSKPNQAIQPTLQPSINTAPQKVVTPSASPINIPSASPVATAPGMNPQHGQPGHRCDIAVGAPLNSKPTQ